MQQLTGQDAMFLHIELDGFPMHIGGVSIYDQATSPTGKVRFKDILAMFESRLDRSPIFRRKLASVPLNLDQPYWIDDDKFDLEFHVRHIALPAPGDWRQLCIQVARLHARPLDRNAPLWEAYVIEGLNNVESVPKGSFAMYLKVHHAAMDGASGVKFFAAFNDISPEPPPAPPPSPWRPESAPKTSSLLTRTYFNNLRAPLKMLRLARDILPARKRIARGKEEGRFRNIEEKASTRFNGHLSPHRVVDSVTFDFEEVRAIKNTVAGCTINDVVLSVVSGAMKRCMGLFHSVNSAVMNKKGTISIAFVACRNVLPEPAFYVDCIQESFAELQAASKQKPTTRTKTKATRKKPRRKSPA